MNLLNSIQMSVFSAEGLVVVGGPLLVTALVLRKSARPGLRRLAHLLLAADALWLIMLLASLSVQVSIDWQLARARRADNARTQHLAGAQEVAGVAFPPGSTVHLDEDGSLDWGSVPVPTRIADQLLVGNFEVVTDGVQGTLAAPAEIDGVPCAADHVRRDRSRDGAQPSHVACTLERSATVNGHELAAGTGIAVITGPAGRRKLDTGTLADAEVLFEVRWPAGTVLHGTAAWPDQLAHARASPGEEVSFCTPSGQDVPVQGIVLHGKAGYQVRETGRTLQDCDGNDHGDERDGTAIAGTERHSRGLQADPAAPWTWNDGVASHP